MEPIGPRTYPPSFSAAAATTLIPHLPELLAGGTPQAEAVRHDWGQTLSDLIRDNYLAPITEFAEAHGTLFRSQTYGEPAVTLADEAVPNLPEGEGPQWSAFSFTRWASSASHLYNRNITSAETWTWLHSPAFRATPLDMKAEADRMFLLGVNQFVGHGYPYSPPAAGEPGWSLYAAAVFNSHNPWFPVMPDVTKYLQRVSWLLRQGKPANDIAVLLPEDDAQAAFTLGHVSVTDEMRKRIAPALMAAILDAGYNIDYIDAATIDKLGVIPYPILILPPTDRIPLETYKKIESYATGSGKVIAIGKLPSLAPGLLEQSDSAQIASLSAKLFNESGHRGILLDSYAACPMRFTARCRPTWMRPGKPPASGSSIASFPTAMCILWLTPEIGQSMGAFSFALHRPSVESWDPDSGDILQSASQTAGARIPLQLAPYESRVFVLKDGTSSREQEDRQALQLNLRIRAGELLADLSTGWQIQFADSATPQASCQSDFVDRTSRQAVLLRRGCLHAESLDRPVLSSRNSHILLDFGAGTPITDNRRPHASGMSALLDPPVREAAIVFVNGQRAGSLWHPPYRIDISKLVHSGENRIEVRVYNTAINSAGRAAAAQLHGVEGKVRQALRSSGHG
jgi:hypothetical protein